MTNRAAAAAFARALFDVSRRTDPGRAGNDLQAFVTLVESHPELLKVLVSPALPPNIKKNIVSELLKLRTVADPVARVILLLAERDQLIILPEIAALYHERLLDYLQVVRAQVTTAAPLAPEHEQALERGLAKATGRRVQMSTRVDPAIIGGLVAQVGSRVFDGSIAGHLARVRERLIEA
jgi:F-type H+-transporting ATPase subunit delta